MPHLVKTIIQTRFRDVPWDEVQAHFPGAPPDAISRWNQMRGLAIQIIAPAEYSWDGRANYRIVGARDGALTHACSLCAEIGD